MATISFKAYMLEFEEVGEFRRTVIWGRELPETRRFGIDADVATNYVYLCEKLENVFPSLRRKYYTVEWRDEEGEIITISTNEELEIAVQEMSKYNICKLYIRLRSNTDRIAMLDDQIEKILHHYKACGVCRKSIRGLRFKCMQCRNYDLCSNCMLLGNHHEHYLVRIVYPVDWSNRIDRRLVHHMRKWAKHCKDDEGKCPHKSNKRGCCPMFNSTSDYHEQKRSKEQHRDPSAEAATEATEDPQETTKHSFSQLLGIVEDNLSNISQFLDPLGINVTVMIDKDSARNKPAGAKASPQKPENRASTSEDSAKKFPGEGKKLHGETTSEKTAAPSTSGASSPQKESAATSAEQASEAEEWAIVQPQGESNNTSRTSSTSSLNEAIPKQVMPSAPAATAAEPEKTESPKQSIYPLLPQEVKDEFYHPNPKIQQAVTAMMAMGFSNEDGWLTHLLVSKDGDIGKALDYIRYANIGKAKF